MLSHGRARCCAHPGPPRSAHRPQDRLAGMGPPPSKNRRLNRRKWLHSYILQAENLKQPDQPGRGRLQHHRRVGASDMLDQREQVAVIDKGEAGRVDDQFTAGGPQVSALQSQMKQLEDGTVELTVQRCSGMAGCVQPERRRTPTDAPVPASSDATCAAPRRRADSRTSRSCRSFISSLTLPDAT